MSNFLRVGSLGVTCIVFFRRHAETGEPIYDQPQVWVYNADDAERALHDLGRLRSMPHLYVPAGPGVATFKDTPELQQRREFAFGDILPNGATVIQCVPENRRMPNGFRSVLARKPDGEYVVWSIDDAGNASSGSYCGNGPDSLKHAITRLDERLTR